MPLKASGKTSIGEQVKGLEERARVEVLDEMEGRDRSRSGMRVRVAQPHRLEASKVSGCKKERNEEKEHEPCLSCSKGRAASAIDSPTKHKMTVDSFNTFAPAKAPRAGSAASTCSRVESGVRDERRIWERGSPHDGGGSEGCSRGSSVEGGGASWRRMAGGGGGRGGRGPHPVMLSAFG